VPGALGALIGALLVVVMSSPVSATIPANCTSTWNGGTGNWDSANWTGGIPGPGSVACIPSGSVTKTTTAPAYAHVTALHIDTTGSLFVDPGAGVLMDGPGESYWAAGSQVVVDRATIGGTGLITAHGNVHFTGGSSLTSINAGLGAVWGGQNGTMNIPSDGSVFVEDSALSVRTRFAIGIFGNLVVQDLGSVPGFITADWGTSTTIVPGGTLELNGDGGYYQESPVSGQGVGQLVNGGLIAKTGGAGAASIVDAAYTQTPTGAVSVDCCTTLAFAGGQVVSGDVDPNMSLGTGVCGPGTLAVCNGSQDPAVDPSSVVLQLSGNAGNTSPVQVQELALPAATTDSRAIGNEVYAHADGLSTDRTQPATITLRFSQADVMSTPLSEVQVGHISDTGLMTKTPDCVGQDLPAGSNYCVVRPVTRNAQNTFVTVKTIETSRWRLRRTGPTENFDQTAPSAPQSPSATNAPPGDGSVLRLSWGAPAGDGGAAVSSYRVFLDGQQVATTSGLSADVKNPGLGAHTLEVAAVNIVGASGKVGATITVKKLSKPRGVKALQGAKGGKLTAGVKWKAPASSGGLQIKAYQVVVLNKAGKVVQKKKVSASKHKLLLKLPSGKYRFKVRAKNLDKYGPFSKPTDLTSPR
jgi:hypothetical protein